MKFIKENLDIILKWLFIIFFFLFLINKPKADSNDFYLDNLKVGGSAFSSSKFVTLPTGNFRISFDLVPYNFQPEQKLYVSIIVCSDYDFEGGFGDEGISNINITNTNKSCKYPNSTYSKGRIKIINFNLVTNVGNEFSGGLSVYSPAPFSIILISFNLSSSNFVSINDLPTDIDLSETNTKIDNTNKKLDDLNSNITDSTGPDISALENSAGWLPPGPVDSILNLPLALFNNLTSNLSKSCQAVTLPLPFLAKNLDLPCLNTIFSKIEGLSTWLNIVGSIASAFILFHYLIGLYKWVDDTLSFRENNYLDNWGGI